MTVLVSILALVMGLLPPATPPTPRWVAPLAACESTGDSDGRAPHRIDPHAVSLSGRYRGAFQFSMKTWRNVGGVGDPATTGYLVQVRLAVRLHDHANPYGQWPTCWPLIVRRMR